MIRRGDEVGTERVGSYGEHAKTRGSESGNERLRKQAEDEDGIFEEMGFKDLLEQGRASHSAIVAQLNKAFISHLKTTWVPETLKKLDAKAGELQFENLKMGMPPAHQSPPSWTVRDAIVKVG